MYKKTLRFFLIIGTTIHAGDEEPQIPLMLAPELLAETHAMYGNEDDQSMHSNHQMVYSAVATVGQNPFISATEIKDIIDTAVQNWENNAVEIPELLPDGDYPELSAELIAACQGLLDDLEGLRYAAAAYPFPNTNYGYQLENLENVRQVTFLINSIMRAEHLLNDRLDTEIPEPNEVINYLNAILDLMRTLQQDEFFNQIDDEHDINLINIDSLNSPEIPGESVAAYLESGNTSFTYLDGILIGHTDYTNDTTNILHNPMPEPLPDAVIEESDEDTDSEDEDIDMEAPGVEEKEVLEEKASMFQFF